MKFKKIVQVLLIGGSILALGACSTTKHGMGSGTSSNANGDGVQSSGLGQNDSYGDQGGSGSQNALAKRIYYFEYDKSDVREDDKPAIFANADYLVAHPSYKIRMEGYTDPRGSREYNVALGERRANAVFEMLKSRGVNPDQVQVVSYGAEKLATPGHSEEDYQQDRRAIIVLAQN